MRLSKKKFDKLLEDNKLVLSLIGMSNMGKTYWSDKLTLLGFDHWNCDNLIESKLGSKLKKLGYSGIADVSKWMGQPYDKRYEKNQKVYLSLEKKVLRNFFLKIKNKKFNSNIVIDTTGSIVHCGADILQNLKKNTLVVYIEATSAMRKEMFERYIKDPKPVVFGDVFTVKKGETSRQALERCYIELLDYRRNLYSQSAYVTISFKSIAGGKDMKIFLNLIRRELL